MEPRRDNDLVGGRGENCSHVRSTATCARRRQTRISKTASREHIAHSQMNNSHRSKGRRAHTQNNQDEKAREQSDKTRSVFDRLGRNGRPKEDLRD